MANYVALLGTKGGPATSLHQFKIFYISKLNVLKIRVQTYFYGNTPLATLAMAVLASFFFRLTVVDKK
jgi:hypothetical protein